MGIKKVFHSLATTIGIVAICLASFFATPILADVPLYLTFEGTFADSINGRLQGSKKLQISINKFVDEDTLEVGESLWSEGFDYAYFSNGFISLELGHVTPLDPEIFDEGPLHFVVEVENIAVPAFFPIYQAPRAIAVGGAKEVGLIRSSDIDGIISPDLLVGDYPNITGLGDMTTLNIGSSVSVNNQLLIVQTSSKNIGILVEEPAYPLDVSGSINIRDYGIEFPDGNFMEIAATRSVYDSISDPKSYTLSADSDETGDGELMFKIANTQAMTISNEGWVGIGVVDPASRLDVDGLVAISANSEAATLNGMIKLINDQFYGISGGETVRLSYPTNEGGGWLLNTQEKTITLVPTAANVAIGTTTPTEKLTVDGTVKSTVFTGSFEGDGQDITGFSSENFSNAFVSTVGGTGQSNFDVNSVIVGASGNVTASVALDESYIIYGGPEGLSRVGLFNGTRNFTVGVIDKDLSVSVNKITTAIGFSDMEHAMYKQNGPFLMDIGGNVGINTENPQVKLDINGGFAVKHIPTASGTIGTIRYNIEENIPRIEVYRNNNWFVAMNLSSFAGWTEEILDQVVRLSPSVSKVGIGTTRPETVLATIGGVKVGQESDTPTTSQIEFDANTDRFNYYKSDLVSQNLDIQPSDGYIQRNDGMITLTDPSDNVVLGDATNTYKMNVDGVVQATSFQTGYLPLPFSHDEEQVLARVSSVGIGDTSEEAYLAIKEGTSTLPALKLGVESQAQDIEGAVTFLGDSFTIYGDHLHYLLPIDSTQNLTEKTFESSVLENGTVEGVFAGDVAFESGTYIGIQGDKVGISPTGTMYTSLVQLPASDLAITLTDDDGVFENGSSYLPEGEQGNFLYEASLKNTFFHSGDDWLQLNYNPLEDGPFIYVDDEKFALTVSSDSVGIGKSPTEKLDIDGTIQSTTYGEVTDSGFYKNGVELPWVKADSVVYLESDSVAIGATTAASGTLLDVAGTINATSFTLNGGPVSPGGEAGGYLTGNYPSPELVVSGVTEGTYGDGQTVAVFDVSDIGLIFTINEVPIVGVVPGGSAGGDLKSVYPFPIVQNIRGVSVEDSTPSQGQAIVWDADEEAWVLGLPFVTGNASGRLAGTYPNPILADTEVSAGDYGASKYVGTFTVDSAGFITGATDTLIAGVMPGGSAGGDLTGLYPNPTLASTNVVAGTYGSSVAVGQFTVDAKGRLQDVTTVNIANVPPGGSAGGDFTGTYPDIYLNEFENLEGVVGTTSAIGQIEIDNTGFILSAENVDIAYATPTGTASGALQGTYPNPELADLVVDPSGTYGDATTLGQFTVNEYGLVESVSNITLSGFPPAGSPDDGLSDLAGTYPSSMEVVGIDGVALDENAPQTGDALVYTSSGSTMWEHITPSPNNEARFGDFDGDYPNIYLAVRDLNDKTTYGSATGVAQVTIDEHGLLTAVETVTITHAIPGGVAGGVSKGSDLEGEYPDLIELVETGVIDGTYGTSVHVPQFEVAANGLVTSMSVRSIIAPPTGNAGGSLSGTFPDPSLATLNIVDDTYGSETEAVVFTVSANGLVTAIENTTLAGINPAGNAGGKLSGTYPSPTLESYFTDAGTIGSDILSVAVTVSENGLIDAVATASFGSVTPGGSASGDLSGTYPSPAVAAIQGSQVSTSSPSNDQTLRWNATTSEWEFVNSTTATPWMLSGSRLSLDTPESQIKFGNGYSAEFIVADEDMTIGQGGSLSVASDYYSYFGFWTKNATFAAAYDTNIMINNNSTNEGSFGFGYSPDFMDGTDDASGVLGGHTNVVDSADAWAAGRENTVDESRYGAVVGYQNFLDSTYKVLILPSTSNYLTDADNSVLMASDDNTLTNPKKSVLYNTIGTAYPGESGIIIGAQNQTIGDYDYIFSGGIGADTAGHATFVWTGRGTIDYDAPDTQTFLVTAPGGFRFDTDEGLWFDKASGDGTKSLYADWGFQFDSKSESVISGYQDGEEITDQHSLIILSTGPGNYLYDDKSVLFGKNIVNRGEQVFTGGSNITLYKDVNKQNFDHSFIFGEDIQATGNLSTGTQILTIFGKDAGYMNSFENNISGSNKPIFVGNFSGSNYVVGNPFTFNIAADDVYLDSDASVYCSGSWPNASDRRFKTNIVDFPYATTMLNQLRPVSYEWDPNQFKNKEGTDIGLIAQEVASIIPDLTTVDFNGHYRIAYDNLFPIVALGVQEHQKDIEQTDETLQLNETSLTEWEQKMERLEEKLQTLENKLN